MCNLQPRFVVPITAQGKLPPQFKKTSIYFLDKTIIEIHVIRIAKFHCIIFCVCVCVCKRVELLLT